MNKDIKKWIDEASFEDLLERWRFESIGYPMFQDEEGKYYIKIMLKKYGEINIKEFTVISKQIGWSESTLSKEIER